MILDFGDYVYNDKSTNTGGYMKATEADAQYQYDNNTFNTFVRKRDYKGALSYASNFEFKDSKKQASFINQLDNFRRKGQIMEQIYSSLSDDKKHKVEFAEAVFIDGGIEALYSENGNINPYVEKFKRYKEAIGITSDGEQPNSLTITVDAEIQGLFSSYSKDDFTNSFWDHPLREIDSALFPNNDNNITELYRRLGATEQELKEAGVQIEHIDGKTKLTFTKDNAYANKLLYDFGKPSEYEEYNDKFQSNFFQHDLTLTANYNGYSKEITDNSIAEALSLKRYISDISDDDKIYNDNQFFDIHQMHRLLNDCMELRDKAFSPYQGPKQYSGTVGSDIDDNMQELRNMYERGELDFNEFKYWTEEYIEKEKPKLLKAIGSSEYEFYSNYFNDSDTDETLNAVQNDDRSRLKSLITAIDKSHIHLNSYLTDNNVIGTIVTIDAGKAYMTGMDKTESKTVQIFIPGFQYEQAQQALNNDTKTKACLEINSMQDYGYAYEDVEGNTIQYNGDGTYSKHFKGDDPNKVTKLDKESVLTELNKDYMVKLGSAALKAKYLNPSMMTMTSGGSISNDGLHAYAEEAMLRAVAMANELHPEISLNKEDGTPLSVAEVFERIANIISTDNTDNIQKDEYRKLETIQDIFMKFLIQLPDNQKNVAPTNPQ